MTASWCEHPIRAADVGVAGGVSRDNALTPIRSREASSWAGSLWVVAVASHDWLQL